MEQASMMQDNLKSAWCYFLVISMCALASAPWEYYKYSAGLPSYGERENWWDVWDDSVDFVKGMPVRLMLGMGGLGAGFLVLSALSLRSVLTRGRAARRLADVMVTVDALKTTNKELKKQYGRIDIDKSESESDCNDENGY